MRTKFELVMLPIWKIIIFVFYQSLLTKMESFIPCQRIEASITIEISNLGNECNR